MPKSTKPPEIVAVKLADLHVDLSLSGRSSKEINANAKALAPAIEAADGWDSSQPGAFFTRDGKKHLARGFTRVAAAEIASCKTGYFVEIADEPATLRIQAIVSNMGKPISAYEQGRIYAGMEAGSDAEKLAVGEVALAPMSQADIAKAVGYTTSHVSKCICIFESPAEIGDLLLEGKVSANVVYAAAKLARKKGDDEAVDEGKQLKIVRAAIKAADDEGKECATEKHFNAIKGEFAPKLKAATSETKKPAASKKGTGTPETEENEQDEAPSDEEQPSGESQPEQEQPQSVMALGSTEAPAPKKASKRTHDELVKDLAALVQAALDIEEISITLERSEKVAEWLVDKGVTIHGSPI